MKTAALTALALTFAAGAAHASTFTYDFKAEANTTGQIGEAIFSNFNTSDNGVFAGPNLAVTATKNGSSAFVYFDNGNAGMGVCGVSGGSLNQYNPGSGANLCNPGSDDGLTTTTEALHFTSTDGPVKITSFFINSNHDSGSILNTVWNIGGTTYDNTDFVSVGGGDVRIDIDFTLGLNETLSLSGVSGPNSYISAIGVTPVPLPAAALLMLAGLGGLGALRASRKA